MNIVLSKNQLRDFSKCILPSLPPNLGKNGDGYALNPATKIDKAHRIQFGTVRLGSHPRFAQGKLRPYVIVSEYSGKVPPNLDVCPSSSQKTSGKAILCLPPRGINLRKKIRPGERKYVKSYIICRKILQRSTQRISKWKFLNNLEEKYHGPLRECLRKARRREGERGNHVE